VRSEAQADPRCSAPERPLRRRTNSAPPFVRGFVWFLALALTIGALIGPDELGSNAARDPLHASAEVEPARALDATMETSATLAAVVAPNVPRAPSDAIHALLPLAEAAAEVVDATREPVAAEADPDYVLVLDVTCQDRLPAADLAVTLHVPGGPTWMVRATESPVVVPLRTELAALSALPYGDDTAEIAVDLTVEARGEARSKLVSTRVPAAGRRLPVATRGPARGVAVRVLTEDSMPVAGARVVLEASGGPARTRQEPGVTLVDAADHTQCDADGRASFDNVSGHMHRLVVSAPGFVPSERLVDVALADATVEVILSRGWTLTGVITLPDGAPADGALVQLCTGREVARGDAPRATTTALDGSYELTGVAVHPAAGAAHVFARHVGPDGRERAAVGMPVADPSGALRWDATVEADQAVEFLVRDGAGQPLPGRPVLVVVDARDATVPYFQSATQTDAGGRARFDVLPLTDLDVFVELGPADLARVARISLKDRAELRDGPRALDVDAARESRERVATGRLSGSFFDARGRPHASAQLVAARDGARSSADVDAFSGSAVLDGLGEGVYELHLVVAGEGVLPLGACRVAPDETYSLGSRFTAPLCPVFVLWALDPPTTQRPWVVEFEPAAPTSPRIPIAVVVQPERTIALLPGRYSIVDERSGARSGVFDVGPSRAAPVSLPRR
jgi:hypothetical protein